MKVDKFFPYAKQSIDESDIRAVVDALKGELITRGPKVAEFEQKIASYCGAKWAVAMTSATTALYGAFQAADVQPADRFITTPNSFIATVAAGMRLGVRPLFVDIERESGNMSLKGFGELCAQAPSRGRFVIAPVHFAGIAMDMKRLDGHIKTADVVIIEDAAHALGSFYPDGSKVGSCSWSQMTVFSFHAIKTITTGEGGCVTTNDDELYRKLLLFRNSGIQREAPYIEREEAPWYYEVQELSGNFHMTELQAALGLSQLARLDDFVQKRRQIVRWYRKHLARNEGIGLFDEKFDERSAYHLFPVQIDFEGRGLSRTSVMQRLKEAGIGSQYHYIPLYRHPVVRASVGELHERFPEMERYYKEALSLPLYVDLQEEDVLFICKTLRGAITQKKR